MMISLLCPTRGRPNGMSNLWYSVYNTACNDDKNIEIIFRIDEDDNLSFEEAVALKDQYPGQVKFIIGPRYKSLGKLTNECLQEAEGEIYHCSADDLIFRTEGWNRIVKENINKYKDGIVFAYGQDMYIKPEQRFGTHLFITKKVVDILGYVVPDLFVGSYLDTYMNRVADIINRKISLPITIEHCHPARGGFIYDQTMMEKFEREKEQNSGVLFYNCFEQICSDAKKLWEVIKNEKSKTNCKQE